MLHVIGIFMTNAPQLGCYGDKPISVTAISEESYLEKEGFPKHAIVCETHIGVGLTIADIEENNFRRQEGT